MTVEPDRRQETESFLVGLFGGGKFQGHGFHIDPPMSTQAMFPVGLVKERAEMMGANFEAHLRLQKLIRDDRIPTLHIWSGTEVFAEAFGSPVRFSGDNMPFALPAVHSSKEADRLEVPSIFEGSLGKIFEIGDRLVDIYGNEYPVRICDIQSPSDIAALIWEKSNFYTAIYDEPEAIHRLLEKVTLLLETFVDAFIRRYCLVCIVHHPYFWLPPEFGICLSEDEVGNISSDMFLEFCYPYMERLSTKFGGIYIHCCANSMHQWDNFLKIRGLIGINIQKDFKFLVKSIEKFSGIAVMVPIGWETVDSNLIEALKKILIHAKDDIRFYFCCNVPDLKYAQRINDELRALLGQNGPSQS